MRRLSTLSPAIFGALLVGGLLTFGLLIPVAKHTAEAGAQSQNCSASCSSPGQPVAAANQKENIDNDDKEPVPPLAYWQQQKINLTTLYGAPILAIVPLAILLRKHLLSTQLRF
mgnify:CR=1 FL=1